MTSFCMFNVGKKEVNHFHACGDIFQRYWQLGGCEAGRAAIRQGATGASLLVHM